ncbi:hypothetical protein [Actinoplanes sp. M2I2]|nr:hypothetical protein [Actinoplanes sp. M2I2]
MVDKPADREGRLGDPPVDELLAWRNNLNNLIEVINQPPRVGGQA